LGSADRTIAIIEKGCVIKIIHILKEIPPSRHEMINCRHFSFSRNYDPSSSSHTYLSLHTSLVFVLVLVAPPNFIQNQYCSKLVHRNQTQTKNQLYFQRRRRGLQHMRQWLRPTLDYLRQTGKREPM